jgi:hypothetical protein
MNFVTRRFEMSLKSAGKEFVEFSGKDRVLKLTLKEFEDLGRPKKLIYTEEIIPV